MSYHLFRSRQCMHTVCSPSLDAIKGIIITATVSPVHGQRHFHQKLFTHRSSLHASPAKHIRPGSKCVPAHPGCPRNLIDASKQLSPCQYGIQNRNMPKHRGEKRCASAKCSTVHENQQRSQWFELGGGDLEGEGVPRSSDLLKLPAGAARISAMAGDGA